MGEKLDAALKDISLTISTGYTEDETASGVTYKTPDHHYLESWNDFEPKKNSFSLSQPAITAIFKSRQAQESLIIWAGEAKVDYYSFVKDNWKTRFYDKAGASVDFQSWWDKCLYEGVFELPADDFKGLSFAGDLSAAATSIASTYNATNTGLELGVFESYAVGSGSQANNPLLQELPAQIIKLSCACLDLKIAVMAGCDKLNEFFLGSKSFHDSR